MNSSEPWDPAPPNISTRLENHGKRQHFARSPHPYHRRSASLIAQEKQRPHLPIPTLPTHAARHSSSEGSESGTEADDERGTSYLRGLPAAPLRGRKGLRGATPFDQTPALSPFPTPPLVPKEVASSYFERARRPSTAVHADEAEKRDIREKYTRRKRAEVVRRLAETALLLAVGLITINGAHEPASFAVAHGADVVTFALITTLLYVTYPFRVSYAAARRGISWNIALRNGFHIPSKFDPGDFLYPVFIPFLIASALLQQGTSFVPANLVLGLASIPGKVLPYSNDKATRALVHWCLSTVPLHFARDVSHRALESLSNIYPLHMCLLPTLEYLVTTSLDPAELQLLSTGLINLFVFSVSPQAEILKALLWLGGLAIFITCRKVLSWEVALARIPTWKFRKAQPTDRTVLRRFDDAICRVLSRVDRSPLTRASSDSEDDQTYRLPRSKTVRRDELQVVMNKVSSSGHERYTMSAGEPQPKADLKPGRKDTDRSKNHPRRSTFSFEKSASPSTRTTPGGRPKRSMTPRSSSFLSMTLAQVHARKWLYASYVYSAVLFIILVPIRHYVSVYALTSHEPFGWAVGYLLGNDSRLRFWIVSHNLESWVSLPEREPDTCVPITGWLERIRQLTLGPANTRLLICAYCLVALFTGIMLVLRLTSVVEVDTRRKVFHGIMVAMLLPTIFVDPCFIALALTLILAIFLLLDLFRASQLPPISKPLTYFLAPYVDGRDHRGPVIVSHIFLLIGCAVPLWLSLTALPRTGVDPWTGWDVATRDLSMVTGVVCVGMGDAAASLIGRRYGRTKWFWGGGKSLEGSTAFVVAVTVGLMAAFGWLRLGGWAPNDAAEWWPALIKSIIAASGASMTETLCTSANDNVIVPLVLWLLVRGLHI